MLRSSGSRVQRPSTTKKGNGTKNDILTPSTTIHVKRTTPPFLQPSRAVPSQQVVARHPPSIACYAPTTSPDTTMGNSLSSSPPSAFVYTPPFRGETSEHLFSQFSPVILPCARAVLSEQDQHLLHTTLSAMSKVDFDSLPIDQSILWNKSLSSICERFQDELCLLRAQFSSLDSTKKQMTLNSDLSLFVKASAPLIKKNAYNLFRKLVFPSHKEVTTAKALSTYDLTSTCALATLAFDDIIFAKNGSTVSHSIHVDLETHVSPCHPFNTPDVRKLLWEEHGIGSLCVKELGRVRNVITNTIRFALSMLLQFYCIPLHLFLTLFPSFFR